jgi:hypothetical protein
MNGVENILNHSSDFGKFDAFRSRLILSRFDNPILRIFIEKATPALITRGYTKQDVRIAKKLICQLDMQLVCREANRRVAFSTILRGTVPSGFSARTTLGNTLYNMAYQLAVTDGLNARSFAAGDDGAFLIDERDKDLIEQRIRDITVSNNEEQTKGCG